MLNTLRDIFEESIHEGREIGGYIRYDKRRKTFSFSKQKGSRSHIIMVPPMHKQFDLMFHTHPFKSKEFGKKPDEMLLRRIENHLEKNNIHKVSNMLNKNIIQLHPPSPDDLKYSIFISKVYKNVPSIVVAQEGVYVIMPHDKHMNSKYRNISNGVHSKLVDMYYKTIWGIPFSTAQKLSKKNADERMSIIHRVSLHVSTHSHSDRLRSYLQAVKNLTGRNVLFLKFQ